MIPHGGIEIRRNGEIRRQKWGFSRISGVGFRSSFVIRYLSFGFLHVQVHPWLNCFTGLIKIHATGIFSAWPAWKFWNLTQTSLPSRISTSSESSPRGAGLEGLSILPATVKVLLWHGQM